MSEEIYRAAVRYGRGNWPAVRGVFASGLLRRSFQLPGIRSSRAYLHWPPDVESTRIENSEESQPDVENQYSTDHEESSLHDPTPAETMSSFAVTYEIVENTSKRGRRKLKDSQGYSYTLQERRGLVTDWKCSIRPKVNPCRATVGQRGEQFQ